MAIFAGEFKFLLGVLLLLAGFLGRNLQAATRTHFYGLNDTFVDELGGPALSAAGGSLNIYGYSFYEGKGLVLANAINPTNYTIVMMLAIAQNSSYRKLIDFKDRVSDYGFYNYNGRANFYPHATATTNVVFPTNGAMVHLVLTRDAATQRVTCYVNASQEFYFTDTANDAVFSTTGNLVTLLMDDNATSNQENTRGFVDYVEIFDGALTASEVTGLFQRAPPRLTIARVGRNISLSWTNLVFGWQLETAGQVSPLSDWLPVTNPPAINRLIYTVAVSNAPGNSFYRLRY